MAKKIRSDSSGVEYMDAFDSKLAKEVDDEIKEAMAEVNKATAFVREQQTFRPAAQTTLSHNPSGPRTTNQFNIVGGTIGQAAIGNEGPVVFNKDQKVFHRGASSTQYEISGGNFSQANIGGTSVYNNKDTKVGAGDGSGATKIMAEELVLHILENGVTTDEFMRLLERNYSLANIAFAIPKDPALKSRMIRALLAE